MKDLQELCPQNIFNQLMFCLSSPSFTEHAEYKNWTPISGRLKCFDKLRGYLELIYPVNKEERKIVPGLFQRILKNLVVNKIIEIDSKKYSMEHVVSLSLLDEKLLVERPEYELSIENDLKALKKISKDDNELLKNNNSLKTIRNEKISQSLQVNKISEIEEEESPEKNDQEVKIKVNTPVKNTQKGNKNNNNFKSVDKSENNFAISKPIENVKSENQKQTKNSSNEISNVNVNQDYPKVDQTNKYSSSILKNKSEKILSKNVIQDENKNQPRPKNYNGSNITSHSPNIEEYEDEIRDVVDDEISEISHDKSKKTNNSQNFNYNNYSVPQLNQNDLKISKNDRNKNSTFKDITLSVSKSKHDLSDLDKEEYFMKSCYDFYDYDICTLTERKVISDTHPIRTSCFSPQGDFFSVGTNSKSVKIFYINPALEKFNKKNSYNFKSNMKTSMASLDDVKLVFEQKNHHMGSIYCLDWSVSGRLIASGSNDKVVKLMVVPNLEESYMLNDQETLEMSFTGHKGTVRAVSFEPTSDFILLSAGTVDTCIKVWDAEKGTNITNLEGHTGDIHTIKWSNDALICGSSGVDKTIRFWDLRDYKSTSLMSAIKYSDINDISIYTKNKSVRNYYNN